ncbi:hypothetical protein SteCoe_6348 [Stentor coeruleus]|uniref:G-protein coupled receptors family 2 profile 2 domain-containing protein n=1 Tax=Stentor coeruleus TaxID=5963 RepID=A0A1R2CQ91_9CILI|nr:hypothetical protein SteCoe_6348 [Stentor coeruleus]
MSLSENEIKLICYTICATLSILGCLLIVILGFTCKKLRTFSYRLIIYLALADLLSSICFIIPDNDNTLCKVQAIIMNFSQLASILITGCISLSLYVMVAKENFSIAMAEKKILGGIIIIPLILTIMPLTTNSYGKSQGWCWIDNDSEYKYMWMLVEFYAPLMFILAFNIFAYIKVYKKFRDTEYSLLETDVKAKFINRLKFYPLSLVVCFGIAGVHKIYYIAGGQENFYLDIFAGCVVALYGFVNSIFYGFTKTVKSYLRKTFGNWYSYRDNSSSNPSFAKP